MLSVANNPLKLSVITLCVVMLNVSAPSVFERRCDIQHNDTQHNVTDHYDTQHKGLICDTQHKGLICDTQQKGLICDTRHK
jgi:hypothetical protein